MARNLATHAIDIWIYLIDCNTVTPYAVGLWDFENYCSEFWTMVRMCLFFNNLPSMTIFQIERRLWKSCQDQERNWCNVHEASWLDFDFVIRHILSIIHLLYTDCNYTFWSRGQWKSRKLVTSPWPKCPCTTNPMIAGLQQLGLKRSQNPPILRAQPLPCRNMSQNHTD